MVQKESKSRLDFIDALRGLAATMVIWFHSVQQAKGNLPGWIHEINLQGARGVQLFYLISAYTLFLTLSTRREKGDTSNFGFFVRRFFRIAPLFYCALIFYLWLYGLAPRTATGNHPISTLNIISNFLFLNGLNPYWINSIVPVGWSVAVEMNFYLMVPVLFLFINNLKRSIWFAALATFFSVVISYIFIAYPLVSSPHVWDEFRFQWIGNQIPVFALGIVLFHFIDLVKANAWPLLNNSKFQKIILFGSILALFILPWARNPYLPVHILYGVDFLLLTLALSMYPSKVIVNRVLIFLGKISYSLYLLHVIGIRIVLRDLDWLIAPQSNLINQLFIYPTMVLGITTLMSYFAYRLIEIPGQSIARKVLGKG